ncbi:hypothetical protein KIN20_016886 [Parelaphostrongylus tenuis]|uniref:SCP domain-containing protein n=1 Tax=Parelaphostrongylus tenuis TaxID=148309 RepID=A0AAD5MMD9_PARTN|nr:hypothetical protein KIN20_016886 [Parelaphostrongylus tenuis]
MLSSQHHIARILPLPTPAGGRVQDLYAPELGFLDLTIAESASLVTKDEKSHHLSRDLPQVNPPIHAIYPSDERKRMMYGDQFERKSHFVTESARSEEMVVLIVKLQKFSQIARATTTSFGCSFSVCNESAQPFVSFVCQFGEPHVTVGVPFYKEDPPRNDCNDSGVFDFLCSINGVQVYNKTIRPCWDCIMSCVNNTLCPEGLLTTCPENYLYGSDESNDHTVCDDDDDNDDSDGHC